MEKKLQVKFRELSTMTLLGKLKKFFKKTKKLQREKSALKKIICFLLRFRGDIAIKIYSASVEFHILESFINTTNIHKIARKNVI